MVSSRVVFSTFVGRPFTHLEPPGSFILKIWKRVVPSESKTSLINPIIAKLVLGGVIDACSHLSDDIHIFQWIGLLYPGCTMLMYVLPDPLTLRKYFVASSLIIPIIVQFVLEERGRGGVVDACSRLPYDIDAVEWNEEGCFNLDVPL